MRTMLATFRFGSQRTRFSECKHQCIYLLCIKFHTYLYKEELGGVKKSGEVDQQDADPIS